MIRGSSNGGRGGRGGRSFSSLSARGGRTSLLGKAARRVSNSEDALALPKAKCEKLIADSQTSIQRASKNGMHALPVKAMQYVLHRTGIELAAGGFHAAAAISIAPHAASSAATVRF